jgi:hypothetical protein
VSKPVKPEHCPDIIYHYTDGLGLRGILSNYELQLGNIEFMNDATELEYARKVVIPQLEDRAEKLWPSTLARREEAAWSRASIIRSVTALLQRGLTSEDGVTYHAYAGCFCADPDLLSQ